MESWEEMVSPGILLIAHGSRNREWVAYIEQAVKAVNTNLPIQISFLELVEGKCIAAGIRALEEQGVKTIIVVPLFITMGSTHLNEIQYALGVIPRPSIETDLTPIPHSSEIIWCSPLEDHLVVKEILSERIDSLSQCAKNEWLLLIGHGSEESGFHERWETLLTELAVFFKEKFGFLGSTHATLHPDNIHARSLELGDVPVITIPVFLSGGYFTRTLIPRKLAGNIYDGTALLPHPLISKWIQETLERALTGEKEYYTL
jgi:sirohydrochlorin cobaltochelatase